MKALTLSDVIVDDVRHMDVIFILLAIDRYQSDGNVYNESFLIYGRIKNACDGAHVNVYIRHKLLVYFTFTRIYEYSAMSL